jgi:hypothetical protein
MYLRLASVVCGSICGVALVFVPNAPLSSFVQPSLSDYRNNFYSGTVESFDAKGHFITLRLPSSFSVASSSDGAVRFSYDADTEWSSVEYLFRSGSLITWKGQTALPERELPHGALVMIGSNANGRETMQARYIIHLKRTEL